MSREQNKKDSKYQYMKLSLEFEGKKLPLTDVQFKVAILDSLKELHGEVGKATLVDVLKYDEETTEAIIRFPLSASVKVWSAITLFSNYQNRRCAFRVHKVAGSLMSLSVDSRQISEKTFEL